jgi:hypothetical protein
MDIPWRAGGAPSGSEFGHSIMGLDLGQAREDRIYEQFANGNVPDFLQNSVIVNVSAGGHSISYSVMPDVLSIGMDNDYLRVPRNPLTAQKIADLYKCSLPTRKMVNDIWTHSPVRLTPHNLPPTAAMTSTKYFIDHNTFIEGQLAKLDWELGQMVSGHKKDVVISNGLHKPNNRVAIYGWINNGIPIQGLNAISHNDKYCDYSHGIRLIDRNVVVDGQPMDLVNVMTHPTLCALVSDEGPIKFTSY